MKIAVVGPAYPIRGGISHYTTYLCKALKEKGHEVKLFSFSRLYPSIIFPGTSQEDTGSREKIFFDSKRSIDSINPLTWRSTSRKIKEFGPGLVIFQWWTPLFLPPYLAISRFLKKNTDAKIIFLCHNIYPHENLLSVKKLISLAFRYPHYFIVHSEDDKKKLETIAKNKAIKVSAHPTYAQFNLDNFTKASARKKLDLKSKNIFLFFGYVKKYKGLIYLQDPCKPASFSVDKRRP